MATKTIQITSAIDQELQRFPKWKVMYYLLDNGESSIYKIAKGLDWSVGKTYGVVNALLKSKSVKARTTVQNGRVQKLVKLVEDKKS